MAREKVLKAFIVVGRVVVHGLNAMRPAVKEQVGAATGRRSELSCIRLRARAYLRTQTSRMLLSAK